MAERTLREKIEALAVHDDGGDAATGWNCAISRVLAVLDAHNAPDAIAQVEWLTIKSASEIAEAYAAENFRMATDSLVLDKAQRFKSTEERQVEGNGYSAAGITARNVAAAIRALAGKSTA